MAEGFRKNVVTVGGLTGLSRILGFVRDLVIAALLGATPLAEAFFAAFRLPNLLRRLLAEGAVSVAFVPVFNEVREREGQSRALEVSREVITFMALLLLAIVLLGELLAPFLAGLIAAGYVHDPVFPVIVHLTRVMFPYILVISLVAFFGGILNSLGHFSAPAAAPIVLNICMIGIPLVFWRWIPWFSSPAEALAWAVLLGGFCQFALQLRPLKRHGVSLKPRFALHDPRIRQVTRLMGSAALAASVYQIMVFLSTMLASLLGNGSISYLYYAGRLMELPLGIFAFAVGNVTLPAMSAAYARQDEAGYAALTGRALSATLLFTVPASVGLWVLAEPVISVLFVRGAFSAADAVQTAHALRMYAVALWAVGMSRIYTQALYARQRPGVVVKSAWWALFIFLAASLLLMPVMRHAGIALASSISVCCQLVILRVALRRSGVELPRRCVRQALLMAGASAGMGLALWPLLSLHFWEDGLTLAGAGWLTGGIVGGAGLYFALLAACGLPVAEILGRGRKTENV